jgi:hypothetical protein
MTEQTTQPISFNDLCKREPLLLALWFEAAADPTTDQLGAWYGPDGYKQRLCDLVGWEASSTTDTVLTSPQAYDIAYHEILGQLERYKPGRRK